MMPNGEAAADKVPPSSAGSSASPTRTRANTDQVPPRVKELLHDRASYRCGVTKMLRKVQNGINKNNNVYFTFWWGYYCVYGLLNWKSWYITMFIMMYRNSGTISTTYRKIIKRAIIFLQFKWLSWIDYLARTDCGTETKKNISR